MKKLSVITGAGISAESNIKTFRDANGLWEGHDIMEVASPQGWINDPKLVLEFYNKRRAQLKEVTPNLAHIALASLEEIFDVSIITQNVDDLHERGGSTDIIHLHGELKKVRSEKNPSLISVTTEDIVLGDLASDGHQLRPHIVWFGEDVPLIETAAKRVSQADVVLIVGTSMNVYPAAGLVSYAPTHAQIYYIDPNPNLNYELKQLKNLTVLKYKATIGVSLFLDNYRINNNMDSY